MEGIIKKALEALDGENEDHWTSLGLPAMDAVNELADTEEDITRAMVNEVFPEYTRYNRGGVIASEPEPEPDSGKELYICNRPKLHIAGRKVPYNEPFEADEWKGKQFKNALRIGAITKVK